MDVKKIILILGPGRSGTSVLMNVLFSLGVSGSDELIEASDANPDGAFEDKVIFDLQSEIFDSVGASNYSPLSDDIKNNDDVKKHIEVLGEIVENRMVSSKSIWAFKDPKTASLLPVWTKIFNSKKITPKYIVAVRDPSAVATSLNKYYGDDMDVAEMSWLIRTSDALYNSGGNCFIVHYESWFGDKAKQIVLGLQKYTGIDASDKDVDQILSSTIKNNLNRSCFDEYEVRNPLVKKLYSEIEKCEGDVFDREKLMRIVIECRQVIKSFSALVTISERRPSNINQTASAKNRQLKEDNSKLTLKTNEQLKEIKSLMSKVEDLEVQNIHNPMKKRLLNNTLGVKKTFKSKVKYVIKKLCKRV